MLRRKFSFSFNYCLKQYHQKQGLIRKLKTVNLSTKRSIQVNDTTILDVNAWPSQHRSLHDKKRDLKKNIDKGITSKADTNSFTYRTHTCGELKPENEFEKVTLCGWVLYSRLSKFLLVRDAYGTTQCVVDKSNIDFSAIALETVVRINGTVALRPTDKINSQMATGEVEVLIDSLEILNKAESVPFNLRDYHRPKEQLRMQYRYIDLRFPEMQSILRKRSVMLHNMRRFLVEKHSFVEVETPTLFCRTPGGAREFVVPTRHSGLFYSLVQSPQQFKQMLMSGGMDRYFQIARCYRDETTRPDRQPEFTQLDIELSFTNLEGVITLIEKLLIETFLETLPKKEPFVRMTYHYAIENYGTDKPDISYDLKLQNITSLIKQIPSETEAYALPYPATLGKFTTKYKEKIKELSKKYKTKVVLNESIVKEFGMDTLSSIQSVITSDKSLIIADGFREDACQCLGEIRGMVAGLLKEKEMLQTNKDVPPFWIIDFPLFVKGEEGQLKPCHHPFTAPHPDDLHLLESDPLKVRSLAYDLVMKGNEVGGGSVRVHDVNLQERLLRMLNIDSGKLSHFLNALRSGCPPHAGIALGIDRLVATACDTESIRDVIAFPKSHDGKDPLSGAPNVISEDDKKYYHLK